MTTVFIGCFIYISLSLSTHALGPWHMCPEDGVKLSQGISQTPLEHGRIIPGLGVKEGLLSGGITSWWRVHIYVKSSRGLVSVRSEGRNGDPLGLWQTTCCSLGLELVGDGTIATCEDFFGNFHEEFGVRMRQTWSLGHCSSVRSDFILTWAVSLF